MENDYSGLDFEQMNATLANPEFANWYYNKMSESNDGETVDIDHFVKMIQEYSQTQLK